MLTRRSLVAPSLSRPSLVSQNTIRVMSAPPKSSSCLGVGTITWEGLKCPVAKGDVSVAVDVSLSRLIPAKLAKGTIEIKAAGASKENLICLDIDTSAATQTLPQLAIAPIVQPNLGPAPFKCLTKGWRCNNNYDCCSKVCATDPAIKPFTVCQD